MCFSNPLALYILHFGIININYIFNSLCITNGFLRQSFNNWMDNAFDDLAEKPVCDNVSDVDGEMSKHVEWKNGDLQEANASMMS